MNTNRCNFCNRTAYRSFEEQVIMKELLGSKVHTPGLSNHGTSSAIDFNFMNDQYVLTQPEGIFVAKMIGDYGFTHLYKSRTTGYSTDDVTDAVGYTDNYDPTDENDDDIKALRFYETWHKNFVGIN